MSFGGPVANGKGAKPKGKAPVKKGGKPMPKANPFQKKPTSIAQTIGNQMKAY